MSKNRLAKKVVDAEKGTVSFVFAPDTDKARNITATLASIPTNIITRLALHGLSQKCGDSYAGAANDGEAEEAVKAVLEDLVAGNWSASRVGVGGVKVAVFVEALARASGQNIEEAGELVSAMSDEEKATAKKHPAIKAAMAAINAERAAARAAKLAASAEGKAFSL